ncbi:hypothetical protein C7S16_4731 [Burkholderia thailandensis]|uniref:Uncharacterized protein n=1 Tax=Burkholderia thailandensis TaxID=57975 RepID=A0AAW9CPM3_BURTH|nr:hypothetical protein [Burkholderia thailandensis]MDW9252367.1 hypothetical protein [Burkholderia thailandensis]
MIDAERKRRREKIDADRIARHWATRAKRLRIACRVRTRLRNQVFS